MTVAAITITFNRLELTKQMVESFYSKTNVDYHLFIDNGSTDGTQEWLIDKYDHILLDKNYGIAYAFACGVNAIDGYDYILKLDNDVEVVSDAIVKRMLTFFYQNNSFVASPTDLLLDPNFAPRSSGKEIRNGFNIEYVTHTGGAFQMMPADAAKLLVRHYRALAAGDYAIGQFMKHRGYRPVYLRDLEMKHIGLNQSTPKNQYIM